jgi:lysophospholipase
MSKDLHKPDNWSFDFHKTSSGTTIRHGHAKPEGFSRGTVIVTGGYGSCIENYYEAINNWLKRNYTVHAMDWEGIGGSERELPNMPFKPSIADFEYHADIFHEFIQDVVKPDRETPTYISTHSKGGNISMRYIRKYENHPEYSITGAILGAPMIDVRTYIPRNIFQKAVNFTHDLGFPHSALPDTLIQISQIFNESVKKRKIQVDEKRQKVIDHYENKRPEFEMGHPTVGWLKQAMDSCDVVSDPKFLKEIKTPILILTAEKDDIIRVKPQSVLAKHLSNAVHVTIPNCCHNIWSAHDKAQEFIWHEIDKFSDIIHNKFKLGSFPKNTPSLK